MLLTLAGWTAGEIGQAFGTTEDSVRRWRARFARGSVDAMRSTVAPGPVPERGERALACARELLAAPVQDRPNWTLPRLRAEIEARGGNVQVARGGGIGGLFSWLFGGGGADDAEESGGGEATTATAMSGNARGGRGGGLQPVEVADVGPEAVAKAKRNRVYLWSGVVILACVAAIVVLRWVLGEATLARHPIVFWLETVALLAFGFSWLTKGQAILKD